MMVQQVFAQALQLAGELDGEQEDKLYALCGAYAVSLASKLRDGLTPEDCGSDFAAAAGLYALASLNSLTSDAGVEEFKAGDLTVKQSGETKDGLAECLERQAQMLIAPYLKDRFAFVGV